MKAVMNVFTDDINEYVDDNVWCDAADVDGVNELHDVMMDTMDSSGNGLFYHITNTFIDFVYFNLV